MTILLSLRHTADLDVLSHVVYQQLITAGCPDLANEAAVMRAHARDASEYIGEVLRLSEELRVEWEEVR